MGRRKATQEETPLPAVKEALSDNDRIERLEEALTRQLDYILQNEVTDLAARIRDIKAAMDMIRAISTEKGAKPAEAPVEISFMD